MGRGGFADRADRPVRRHPFAGGMHERCGKSDQVGLAVDGSGLNDGDLVLAQAFADQIEPRGEGRISKRSASLPWKRRDDGRGQGFLRIGDCGLGLGERRRQCAYARAELLHGWPLQLVIQS